VVVVKRSGGGWLFPLASLLLVIGGGALIAYILFGGNGFNRGTTQTVAAADTDFRLPEIIPNPEKDGERPPVEFTVEDESQFHFPPEKDEFEEPKPDPKPDPKAKPAAPKPEVKPDISENRKKYLVQKNVTNKHPGLKKIPEDRIVDILCVFTAQYKHGYGRGKGLEVLKRANYLVNSANAVYKREGTNCALRIVGLVEVDYFDADRSHDLGNLSANRIKSVGGYDIRQLRQKTGADLVCLLGTKGGGGVAHCPGVYSVVKRGGPGILTHEIQHNFGWKHGMQKPKGRGDEISIMKSAAPRLSSWMPKKIPENTVYVEYLTRNK
jgi:hypothetical protein